MAKNVANRMREENYRITNFDPNSQKGKGCCDPILSQYFFGEGTPEDNGIESIRGVQTIFTDTSSGDTYSDIDGSQPFAVVVPGGVGANTLYSADDNLAGDRVVEANGNTLTFRDTATNTELYLNKDNAPFTLEQVGITQQGRNPALTGFVTLGDFTGVAQGQDQLFLGWTDQGAGTENQAFGIFDCDASGTGFIGFSAWSKLTEDARFSVLADASLGTGLGDIQLKAVDSAGNDRVFSVKSDGIELDDGTASGLGSSGQVLGSDGSGNVIWVSAGVAETEIVLTPPDGTDTGGGRSRTVTPVPASAEYTKVRVFANQTTFPHYAFEVLPAGQTSGGGAVWRTGDGILEYHIQGQEALGVNIELETDAGNDYTPWNISFFYET